MRFLHDVLWVALYELGEALRTRLFQLAILAYVGGIGFAGWLFTVILRSMENALAATLGVPETQTPGTMTQQLWSNGDLTHFVGELVGPDNVEAAKAVPLIALWCGEAAMMLLPAVILYTAGGSLASEVRSRSIRFLLVRTGRLEVGLGKLLGQIFLAAIIAFLGALLVTAMGMALMVGNDPLALFSHSVLWAARAVAYTVPWAGLALAASALLANPHGARAIAAVAFLTMPVAMGLRAWAQTWNDGRRFGSWDEYVGDLAELIEPLTILLAPTAWSSLISLNPATVAFGAVHALSLGVIYYGLGHVVLARRDL